jgi:hypothetical protein
LHSKDLLAYGIAYGKQIGLRYEPQLTTGGEAITGATQQSIKVKLDQAKASGATEFNLWREGNTYYLKKR